MIEKVEKAVIIKKTPTNWVFPLVAVVGGLTLGYLLSRKN